MLIAPTRKPVSRGDRLEPRQHEKRGAPCNGKRAQRGNQNQLARLRLAPFKDQRERCHAFEQDKKRDHAVALFTEVDDADENRQRYKQKRENACKLCPAGKRSSAEAGMGRLRRGAAE